MTTKDGTDIDFFIYSVRPKGLLLRGGLNECAFYFAFTVRVAARLISVHSDWANTLFFLRFCFYGGSRHSGMGKMAQNLWQHVRVAFPRFRNRTSTSDLCRWILSCSERPAKTRHRQSWIANIWTTFVFLLNCGFLWDYYVNRRVFVGASCTKTMSSVLHRSFQCKTLTLAERICH